MSKYIIAIGKNRKYVDVQQFEGHNLRKIAPITN